MSSIIKVKKEGLNTVASNLSIKMAGLAISVSEAKDAINNVPSHKSFPALRAKCSQIFSSLSSIEKDYNKLSGNVGNYVNSLIAIDGEGFVIGTPEAPTANVTVTASESGSWAANSTAMTMIASTSYTVGSRSNLTSRSSSPSTIGNYTYSYSASPNGTLVHTSTGNSNTTTTGSFGTVNPTYNPEDRDRYNYKAIEHLLDSRDSVTIDIPAGLGSVHTYMGWQCITATGSTQYKLRDAAGMNFDEEGFAKIGDRYVVATTNTFGNVGDFIDVYQEDGTVIKCVIGDIKAQSDAGCTQWGHNNGQCVVEFVVDKSTWYSGNMHANPGTNQCHPEWNQNITKIVNRGNFFDLIKEDAAMLDYDSTTTEAVAV